MSLVVPLGDCCEVLGGATPSKKVAAYYDGEIPWATVRDLQSDLLRETEFRITPEALASCSSSLVPAGNVIIATRVGLGKVAIAEQDTAINQDLRGLIPRDEDALDRRYLLYVMKALAPQIVDAGTGATVQGVRLEFIKSLPIPLPSLDEQRRIVATLDEFTKAETEIRRKQQKRIDSLEALFANSLATRLSPKVDSRADSTELVALGELCDIQSGFAFKSADYQETGAFLMRIGNVQDGQLTTDNPAYISLEHERLEKFSLNCGDLLVSLTGNLGRVGEVKTEHLPAALNQRVARVSVASDSLDQRFLFYFLSSADFREALAALGHGAAQQNVSPKSLSDVRILLPSLDEQLRTVATLNEISSATSAAREMTERSLAELDSLRSSTLKSLLSA